MLTFLRVISNMDPSKEIAVRDGNCIFCKIIDRQIPSNIANITQARDAETLGSLFMKVGEIARSEKLDKGFRTIINTGDDGGQTVDHLHIHIIGGRQLDWPPG